MGDIILEWGATSSRNRWATSSRNGWATSPGISKQAVQKIFREQNLPVTAFEVKRDGEPYEFDAIVPWDGYLFVFECKNRSLSGNDPVRLYYFDLRVSSDVKQALRLKQALLDHPDIIEQNVGKEFVNWTIVPCIVHSLPYSRVGNVDGVFFTDLSALGRFFNEAHVRLKTPHRVGNMTVLHRAALKSIWEGDAPTAADFLRQLQEPTQLDLSLKHLDTSPMGFPIGPFTMVATQEIIRAEMTAHSIAEAFGVDGNNLMQDLETVSDIIDDVRSKREKRGENPS